MSEQYKMMRENYRKLLAGMSANIVSACVQLENCSEYTGGEIARWSVSIARGILEECGIEEEVKLSLEQIKDDSEGA